MLLIFPSFAVFSPFSLNFCLSTITLRSVGADDDDVFPSRQGNPFGATPANIFPIQQDCYLFFMMEYHPEFYYNEIIICAALEKYYSRLCTLRAFHSFLIYSRRPQRMLFLITFPAWRQSFSGKVAGGVACWSRRAARRKWNFSILEFNSKVLILMERNDLLPAPLITWESAIIWNCHRKRSQKSRYRSAEDFNFLCYRFSIRLEIKIVQLRDNFLSPTPRLKSLFHFHLLLRKMDPDSIIFSASAWNYCAAANNTHFLTPPRFVSFHSPPALKSNLALEAKENI